MTNSRSENGCVMGEAKEMLKPDDFKTDAEWLAESRKCFNTGLFIVMAVLIGVLLWL